jgi:hypothetical protein
MLGGQNMKRFSKSVTVVAIGASLLWSGCSESPVSATTGLTEPTPDTLTTSAVRLLDDGSTTSPQLAEYLLRNPYSDPLCVP